MCGVVAPHCAQTRQNKPDAPNDTDKTPKYTGFNPDDASQPQRIPFHIASVIPTALKNTRRAGGPSPYSIGAKPRWPSRERARVARHTDLAAHGAVGKHHTYTTVPNKHASVVPADPGASPKPEPSMAQTYHRHSKARRRPYHAHHTHTSQIKQHHNTHGRGLFKPRAQQLPQTRPQHSQPTGVLASPACFAPKRLPTVAHSRRHCSRIDAATPLQNHTFV